MSQTEEDLSHCVFTGVLEVKNIELFDEIKDVIDKCFSYTFDKVSYGLPEGQKDLKELIYYIDDNKKHLNATFEFSYENDFSAFQLVHKQEKQVICVDQNEVQINFNTSTSIPEMIKALQEVNKKVFLT